VPIITPHIIGSFWKLLKACINEKGSQLRRLLKEGYAGGRSPYPPPYMHSRKFLEVFELSSLGKILLKAAHLLKVLEVIVY
tara:strand:- start:2587 stop:2829 length:243 start_codon:yes stop_codon:yes gene_type:complete